MYDSFDIDDYDFEEEQQPPHKKEWYQLRKPVCPYICSTPLDFNIERDFLNKNVYPNIAEFAKNRGVVFSTTDISWTAEDKVFSSGELLRFLLDSISKCSPFFICLLGECYGPHRQGKWTPLPEKVTTVPENCDPLDKNFMFAASAGYSWVLQESHQGCSITELEIIHAAFLADDGHSFFYFRQPEHLEEKYLLSEEHEVDRLYHEENEHSGLKIKDLRQRIVKKDLPVKYFSTLEQLANLVLNDWIDLIDLMYPPLVKPFNFLDNETYHEWLIQESFAENRRSVYVSCPENESVIQQLSEFALTSLDTVCSDYMCEQTNNRHSSSVFGYNRPMLDSTKYKSVLCLTGDRGAGKSSIIAKWLQEFDYLSADVPLISHFIGCSSHSTDICVFLDKCVQVLRQHFLNQDNMEADLDHLHECCSFEDKPNNFRDLCEAFIAAVSLGPCVLVLDGIDELCGSVSLSPQTIKELNWLAGSLPAQCKIIMTTTRSDITYRSLCRRQDTKFITTPVISSEDRMREIIHRHSQQHFQHLTDKHLSTIHEIKLSAKPLFLTALSSEIQCYNVYTNLDNFLQDNLEISSVREFWMKNLKRWVTEFSWLVDRSESSVDDSSDTGEYSGWVGDALCLLLLSRSGLTEDELLQMLINLGYNGSLEVTSFDWYKFRMCLGSALHERVDGLMCFSHHHIKDIIQYILLKSLKAAHGDLILSQDINSPWYEYKRKLHHMLASFFSQQPYNQRKVEELPWQLMMAGNTNSVLKIVEHVDYFLDLADKTGHYPSNRRDLMTYWEFLEHHGIKADVSYMNIFMKMGLLESDIRHLESASVVNKNLYVIEEMPLESEEELRCPECFPEAHKQRRSFTMSADSNMFGNLDDRLFIFEAPTALHIKGDGKVLEGCEGVGPVKDFAWHVSQLLTEMGYCETAEKILHALILFLKKNFPLTHDCLVACCKSLEVIANMFHSRGDVAVAEMLYKEALSIVSDLMDFNEEMLERPELRTLKSRLLGHHGSIRLDKGEVTEAEELLKEALDFADESVNNIPLTATILYNLGLLRAKQGDTARAESCLRQSLTLREQWFGKTHTLVADVLSGLAKLLSADHKGCDKVQAEHLYRRVIQIREDCLGSKHLRTADTLFLLGCLIGQQTSLTAKNESIKLLKQALDITTSHLGVSNCHTKKIQKALTNQEVMLRLGNYEFGHAKPMDMRSRNNPFSTLTLRDKDLKKLQPKTALEKPIYEALNIRAVTREEMLHYSRPISFIGSANSFLSASEKLYTESERLLRRNSIERKLKLESSPLPRSRLTVDMNFVADSTSAGEMHKDMILDTFAVDADMEVQEKQTPPQKAVKSRIKSRPQSDPFKTFIRFASASSERSHMSSRLPASAKSRSKSASSSTAPPSSSSAAANVRCHDIRCTVPSPHSLHTINHQTVVGPHSTVASLLNTKSQSSRNSNHQHHSAWYHVPGRYSTPEKVYPAKRNQSRPSSVVSTQSRQSRPRSMSSHSTVMSRQSRSDVKFVLSGQSDTQTAYNNEASNENHCIEKVVSSTSTVTFQDTVTVA